MGRAEQMRNITLSYVFFESESEIPEEYRHLTAGEGCLPFHASGGLVALPSTTRLTAFFGLRRSHTLLSRRPRRSLKA